MLLYAQKLPLFGIFLETKRYQKSWSLSQYPPFCVGETMDEVNTVYILLFGSGPRLIANWGFIVNQQPADVNWLLIGWQSPTSLLIGLFKSHLSLTEVDWTSLDIHLIRINEIYEKLDVIFKILLARIRKRLHWLAVKKYLYKEFCSILFCSTTEMI